MNEKKNLLRLLGCIGICVFLFGGFVWVADPFYHYHKPVANIPIILENAVYQTPGAAANLEYDSAVIGTSMLENVHTNWLDEAWDIHTMKLCYAGARSSDLQAIFGQVDKKQGELKYVIMDINDYQLTEESWTAYVERPKYLYDSNFFNDYQYLFNHDTFLLSMKRCLDGMMGMEDNVDAAYVWEEDELFGRELALSTCREERETSREEKVARVGEGRIYEVSGICSEKLEEGLTRCEENLANIIPFIQNHTDTEFVVLVPPYSMLYWEQKVLDAELEDMMAIYAHAFEKFLEQKNVRIFYFQYEPEIISNIDNYRDNCHHKPIYNRYMIDCVIAGEKELTIENYKDKLLEMYNFAKEFDYEALWIE